ncbi:N-acetylglucosamine-6-phosphate deacetylase [Kytococcus sedentarius]|uniref:N-acetylglucosamine-6-phosphate deacetylase n=1 Tax=Kytococcus sedentarius TaxID=1276 RepID=UPI0035BC929D
MLLTTSRVFDGHQLGGPATLHIEGDRVAALVPGEVGDDAAGAPPASERGETPVELPAGWLVAPGFVDVHCHGGGGASFSDDADGIVQVLATHRAAGTTSSMASTVTESVDDLCDRARTLAPFAASGELLGMHLEGPWLSPDHRGAHDPALLQTPQVAAFDRIQAAAGGAVRMVTLAPELEGGLDLVRHLAARGIVAAVGHCDATHEVATQAFDAGATAATHLFNAMRGIHHREPGPVTAALEDERVCIELIADGVHLAAPILSGAMRIAGDRAVLVTDAMAAAGQPDGDYRLGGLAVRVTDGVARLVEGGAIAGSTLTMAEAVRHCIEQAGVEPQAVLRAATSAPASMVGAADVGRLAPGTWADAVVLDETWTVRGVLRRGQWIRPLG